MSWIRLETDRYPPPTPKPADQTVIDAEHTVVNDPPPTPHRRWRAARRRGHSMLEPFWSIRVILRVLLWPVRYLLRMTVVTIACLMILMRPFILFFYAASFAAFCAMWFKIVAGQFQLAGTFAFWSVALGAVPAVWDFILATIAPDMVERNQPQN